MRKKVVSVVSVVLLAFAVGGGYWLGQRGTGTTVVAKSPSTPSAATQPGVAIEATKVSKASMPQGITAVGSLRSDESITLRPEVAGRISAITFREGERVAKGAPLIKLDPSVTEAEAQQARANLTLAKAKYTRAVDLEKQGFISGQARDEAENNLRVSEAILAVAEAKLSKLSIAAPFAGIIGLRSVSIGDYVKEGTDMVNLESVDTLKVDFRVPEIYLTQVRVGQTLQLTLDAMPGKSYEGTVFAINPLIDAAGRSVVIRAQVRNQGTVLRPGMFARVRLLTRDVQDTLAVPEQAIVPQGDEWYVYRVVDGKAQRAKVEIGQRRDGKTEIISGLQDGDVVVTAGQLKLRDGVPVQIAGASGPATATVGKDAPVVDRPPAKTEAAAPPTPKS